ncbi:FeoB-associated Cys-rich membrane protein [Ruminococcus bicirculans]|nr:FeoB-associated Cys-rich membrane protein [Ruminococcus bicirculans (ex Wegman et al. 2014)]
MAVRLCGISDRSIIMNTADWIVVILLLLWVVAAAINISKQKKKGKCCGCCSHCHSRCGKK